MGKKETPEVNITVKKTENGYLIEEGSTMSMLFLGREDFENYLDSQEQEIENDEQREMFSTNKKKLAKLDCKYYILCGTSHISSIIRDLYQAAFMAFLADYVVADSKDLPPLMVIRSGYIQQIDNLQPEMKKMLEEAGYEFEEGEQS